jgi:hypothetical protein
VEGRRRVTTWIVVILLAQQAVARRKTAQSQVALPSSVRLNGSPKRSS